VNEGLLDRYAELVVIGSDEVTVGGTTKDGREVPLLHGGACQI
jgi:hypothetical protein